MWMGTCGGGGTIPITSWAWGALSQVSCGTPNGLQCTNGAPGAYQLGVLRGAFPELLAKKTVPSLGHYVHQCRREAVETAQCALGMQLLPVRLPFPLPPSCLSNVAARDPGWETHRASGCIERDPSTNCLLGAQQDGFIQVLLRVVLGEWSIFQ